MGSIVGTSENKSPYEYENEYEREYKSPYEYENENEREYKSYSRLKRFPKLRHEYEYEYR